MGKRYNDRLSGLSQPQLPFWHGVTFTFAFVSTRNETILEMEFSRLHVPQRLNDSVGPEGILRGVHDRCRLGSSVLVAGLHQSQRLGPCDSLRDSLCYEVISFCWYFDQRSSDQKGLLCRNDCIRRPNSSSPNSSSPMPREPRPLASRPDSRRRIRLHKKAR